MRLYDGVSKSSHRDVFVVDENISSILRHLTTVSTLRFGKKRESMNPTR